MSTLLNDPFFPAIVGVIARALLAMNVLYARARACVKVQPIVSSYLNSLFAPLDKGLRNHSYKEKQLLLCFTNKFEGFRNTFVYVRRNLLWFVSAAAPDSNLRVDRILVLFAFFFKFY